MNNETFQKINLSEPLTIGYLINPDKIFYNEMDDVIVNYLEKQGATVIKLTIEEIFFSLTEDGIAVYLNKKKIHLDGFLSYGYMSKIHYEAYYYIVSGMEMAGIPCLHTSEAERILNNKFQQSLRFIKAGIKVPSTHMGFGVSSYKEIAEENYKEKSILKKLDDYGGDGVSKYDTKEHLVNGASKLLWNNEYCIIQKYVPDSLGKSIRVLCIDGKAVAVAEYEDKTNNFRSNHSFGYENFSLNSLMLNENFSKYAEIGEKAIKSIGNLTIGGVDILDSKIIGCVVLEVNGWPDIFDIANATQQDIFEKFTQSFLRKCNQVKVVLKN